MDYLDINFWKQFNIKSEHNMNRYINFIKSIRDKGERNLDYYERHHIVPKSFIDNNEIIKLTAREHFIAHHILARALGGKMVFAFHRMCYANNNKINGHKEKYKVKSSIYEELRIMNSKETIERLTGKKWSEKNKKILSEAQKKFFREHPDAGKKIAESRRKNGIWNPKGGKICVNNGIKSKFIFPNELDKYLSLGFIRGSLIKFSDEHKKKISERNSNKIMMTNGKENKWVYNDEQKENLIKLGFRQGMTYKSKLVN